MEKLITLLLAFVLALGLTGCKSEEEKAQERLQELYEERRELQSAADAARAELDDLREAFDKLDRYSEILGN